MKRRVITIISMALFCAIISFITTLILYEAEPDFCALCHPAPYHAPCIVNITTGDITELAIYEAHAVKVGEVAPTQSGGYMRYSMSGGLSVHSSPDTQTANASIPIEPAKLNRAEFCFDCRKLLSSATSKYVLADLYEPENIKIFDIVDGPCCAMRVYEVSAVFNSDGTKAEITNIGHMLDG